ncbi:YvrJ family protein [Paenibacillus sp. FSL R10-2736]|uniref:YvrJ family protein n=1 Tax=Paenibacillus sp. FSL R10-2736 TaxID=2954692 RepID=UPI0030FB0150
MDSEAFTIFITAINNVGFPIVMIGYLVIRFEKKIDALTNVIHDLLTSINESKEN